MTIQAAAQSVDICVDDEDGMTSLFIKWGTSGQYIDLTRGEGCTHVHCELCDQSNGREFDSLTYHYHDRRLVIEVSSPESLMEESQENRVEMDLSEIEFDEYAFVVCLKHLFQRG